MKIFTQTNLYPVFKIFLLQILSRAAGILLDTTSNPSRGRGKKTFHTISWFLLSHWDVTSLKNNRGWISEPEIPRLLWSWLLASFPRPLPTPTLDACGYWSRGRWVWPLRGDAPRGAAVYPRGRLWPARACHVTAPWKLWLHRTPIQSHSIQLCPSLLHGAGLWASVTGCLGTLQSLPQRVDFRWPAASGQRPAGERRPRSAVLLSTDVGCVLALLSAAPASGCVIQGAQRPLTALCGLVLRPEPGSRPGFLPHVNVGNSNR